MDPSTHPTKRRAQDQRRTFNRRYRNSHPAHKTTSSISLSPEVLERAKTAGDKIGHKESFDPLKDEIKANTRPSLLDHEHPSFTDVDLDFRHIIEEIDHAIARNLRTKSHYEVPAHPKRKFPNSLPREAKSSPSPDPDLSKDELFQYISNLPMESGSRRPVLAVERVAGMSIAPGIGENQVTPAMTQTLEEQRKGRNAGTQTEEKPWNPAIPLWQVWMGPASPYQTWSPSYRQSDRISSPESRRRPIKKRQKPKQTSARETKPEMDLLEAANLRESAELASIRALLLSPGKSKTQRKSGEIVLISDAPTLSLSKIFETRKKSLLLKMQARDASIPIHSDPVQVPKDALLRQRETQRMARQSRLHRN